MKTLTASDTVFVSKQSDKRFSITLAALAVVAFYCLSIVLLQSGAKTLGASSIADEILTLALTPFAILGFLGMGSGPRLFVCAYFALYLVSGVFALTGNGYTYPPEAFYVSLLLEAKPYIFTLAFFQLFKDHLGDGVHQLAAFFLGLAVANSFVCVLDWLQGSGNGILGFPLLRGIVTEYAPSGLFSHKTSSAVVTAAGVVAALSLARNGRKGLVGIAVYLTIILALHNAAKEFAAVIVVILTYALVPPQGSKNRITRFAASLLVLSGIAAVTAAYVLPTFSQRLEVYGSEESVRSMMYSTSLSIAADRFPLGTGGGTFGSAPSREVYYSDVYHNYGLSRYFGASPEYSFFLMDTWWPKILGESGLFGFLANAWFWGSLWVALWWQYIRRRGQHLFFLLGGANLIMLSSVAAAVFTSGDHVVLLGAAFGGALVVIQQRPLETKAASPKAPLAEGSAPGA
jgi:hypothetical protein